MQASSNPELYKHPVCWFPCQLGLCSRLPSWLPAFSDLELKDAGCHPGRKQDRDAPVGQLNQSCISFCGPEFALPEAVKGQAQAIK